MALTSRDTCAAGGCVVLATKIRWVERMSGAAIIAYRCRRKIRRLAKGLPLVDDPALKSALRKRYDGYSYDLWHKVYAAVSGHSCVDYVPEDLFYNVFYDRLDPRHRRVIFRDKNYFDRMSWPCLPETIFRIVGGRLFDKSYRMIDAETALSLARESGLDEFVVKPSRASGGGNMVTFRDYAGLASFLPANMGRHSDWIVQRPIVQHPVMAELNDSSVNTIRIVTIRLEAKVSFVVAFQRIGIRGVRVDNLSAGNIAVGIEEDGRLRKHGYDFALRRHTAHPDRGYAFDSFVIPSYEAAKQTCIDLHERIQDLDLISWDIAIDHGGAPAVIEVNVGRQDANLSQICNGPVFSPFIDSVLARNDWFVIPGIGAIDRQADMEPEFIRH